MACPGFQFQVFKAFVWTVQKALVWTVLLAFCGAATAEL